MPPTAGTSLPSCYLATVGGYTDKQSQRHIATEDQSVSLGVEPLQKLITVRSHSLVFVGSPL
jgi:hypothetical protein